MFRTRQHIGIFTAMILFRRRLNVFLFRIDSFFMRALLRRAAK